MQYRELRTHDQYQRAKQKVARLEKKARSLTCTCFRASATTKEELDKPGTCERCLTWAQAISGAEYLLMYNWQEENDLQKRQAANPSLFREQRKTPDKARPLPLSVSLGRVDALPAPAPVADPVGAKRTLAHLRRPKQPADAGNRPASARSQGVIAYPTPLEP